MDTKDNVRNAILSLIKSSPIKLTYQQIAENPTIRKLIYESRLASGQDPKRYDIYWREVKRRLHSSPVKIVPHVITTIKPKIPQQKKQPWEMTKQEWLDINIIPASQTKRKKQIGNLTLKEWKLREHENYVEQAIIDKNPVPERVLLEYPNLLNKSKTFYPEQEAKETERIKMEKEHERTFGNQHLDEELAAIYPWFEKPEDYYDMDSISPFDLSPEEEEFNDLFAEAVFKGAINTDPAPNKLIDPEAIYYRWQALFNHNPDKTIKSLKDLIKNV